MSFKEEIAMKIENKEKELKKVNYELDKVFSEHDIEEPGIEQLIYSLSGTITSIENEVKQLKSIFWNLKERGMNGNVKVYNV